MFVRSTLVAALGVVACAAACGAPEAQDGSVVNGALTIYYSTMYSSVDGVHTFKMPATVAGVTGVKWTASDPSLVDLEPNSNGSEVMITMKKAGSLYIYAQVGNLKGQAPLFITQATPEEWEDGNQRYNNGIVFARPAPGQPRVEQSRKIACTNCHGKTESTGDVEHTPTQTGGYSDADLINIFSLGRKPAGVQQRVMPLEQWSRIHQWETTESERKGIIVYLRSLTPKSQGAVDFGGRGPRPDGGPPGFPPPPFGDAGSS